ncbi:MAG: TIGR01212 family radical SAM protein [bacterium]|nr:TIGR01212 family radical SAM protein [bacterium]
MTSVLPYTSLSEYLRQRHGAKVVRIPLTLHQVCPQRAAGRPGCLFCLPAAYAPPAAQQQGTAVEQLQRGIAQARARGRATKFVAYLQSGSNTHGEPAALRRVYEALLAQPDVVALSIATRPDCLDDAILAVLADLSRQHDLWVELGVQTLQERSLTWLQRGHDAACARDAVRRLREIGIAHIVAHLILGLPGETIDEMHASVRGCVHAGVHGLKLHHLQVMRDTPLEAEWRAGRVPTLTLDAYATVVAALLARVPREIVIHRLCASTPAQYLCAPLWPGTKTEHLAAIMRALAMDGDAHVLRLGVLRPPRSRR